MICVVCLLFCCLAGVTLNTNIWLSKWTDQAKQDANNTAASSINKIHGLAIYSALGCSQGKIYIQLYSH